MRTIKLFIVFLLVLQSVHAESLVSLATTLNNSHLLKIDHKPFIKFWSEIRPGIKGTHGPKVDAYLKQNKKLEVPDISWTKLHKSESSDAGFRLILNHSEKTFSIDLIDNPKIAAIVNGVIFSHEDLKSYDVIMNKLILAFYSKNAKKKTALNSATEWDLLIALLLGSKSFAAATTCTDQHGKICWDDLIGKTVQDASQSIKQLLKDRTLSPQELQSYLDQATQARAHCSSNCEQIDRRIEVMTAVRADRPQKRPPSAPTPSSASSPAVETMNSKETTLLSQFWEDNDSWLKPALIITGSLLATWGLCKTNVINIFSCGKKDNDNASSALLATSLPTESAPTSAVYTGTGTK